MRYFLLCVFILFMAFGWYQGYKFSKVPCDKIVFDDPCSRLATSRSYPYVCPYTREGLEEVRREILESKGCVWSR